MANKTEISRKINCIAHIEVFLGAEGDFEVKITKFRVAGPIWPPKLKF